MRVLFDNGTPAPLGPSLVGHAVEDARDHGWERLANGDLLTVAETAGFDVLVTTDQNMRFQQNLTARRIAIVALGNGQWPRIRAGIPLIVAAVNAATPG